MSHVIEITGWETAMQKVSCTELLRDYLGIGLSEAKQLTDKILAGSNLQIPVESAEAATSLLKRLGIIGVAASMA